MLNLEDNFNKRRILLGELMEKLKVTFKKYPKETGLAAIGYSNQSADIKIKKRVIGTIFAPNWQTPDNKWSVGFMVMKTEPDDNPNCDWRNIRLKAKFDTYENAKQFVVDNIEKISQKYEFNYQ
jgi:hypothetical protein